MFWVQFQSSKPRRVNALKFFWKRIDLEIQLKMFTFTYCKLREGSIFLKNVKWFYTSTFFTKKLKAQKLETPLKTWDQWTCLLLHVKKRKRLMFWKISNTSTFFSPKMEGTRAWNWTQNLAKQSTCLHLHVKLSKRSFFLWFSSVSTRLRFFHQKMEGTKAWNWTQNMVK